MIFIKHVIIKTRKKISSLPKIENDITIFAFTKPSKFLIVILEQVAPPMDIYPRIQSIVGHSHNSIEASGRDIKVVSGINIPLYRTIAKSNLTMDVPRYNSANDRHARCSFQKLRSPIRSKGRNRMESFLTGDEVIRSNFAPISEIQFPRGKSCRGEVCHQWRRALAREREKNGGGDGTVEKACPRRFR